jgi:ubiquinone/menaquinone biosynthesis C-methylase UbiE
MNYSGLANINDFDLLEWKNIFHEMESYQEEFLKFEHQFRSSEYKWPGDALHNWSRLWEYPYVYYHLNNFNSEKGKVAKVVDVGSGVTFFTTFLAGKGYQITATDIDPITETDLNRAFQVINTNPGKADVRICTADKLPFDDESCDAAISISVIEHVVDFEKTIKEIYRILKKDGIFILTFDIDLNNNHELKPDRYIDFKKVLFKYFKLEVDQQVIHPQKALTSLISPYPYPIYKTILHKLSKNFIRKIKDVMAIKYYKPYYLTCEGVVLRKITS